MLAGKMLIPWLRLFLLSFHLKRMDKHCVGGSITRSHFYNWRFMLDGLMSEGTFLFN